MNITDTFYAATRDEWRRWLAAHHDAKDEIWLVSSRKEECISGRRCRRWIPSQLRSIHT